ncbi:MAG: PP0621 family protein [Pseudomonadota bacterium]|nr:PP0621 family protein [Pseudomonadota bacterium]
MKLLIVLLAVLAGVWLWQRGRRLQDNRRTDGAAPRKALPMVRCHRCGVHVPGGDAIKGREGAYCSLAHRRDTEGA